MEWILQATSLQTLIPWKLEELHEPVYTCKLSREQLSQILEKTFPVPKYSIHTQVKAHCKYSTEQYCKYSTVQYCR